MSLPEPTSPVLRYGDVRLLNLPHARAVAEEVLVEDCYRIKSIPPGAHVIDLGAFYGEFSLACALRGHTVDAFEASPTNHEVMKLNKVLNRSPARLNNWWSAVVGTAQPSVGFAERGEHPAGSLLAETAAAHGVGGALVEVPATTLSREVANARLRTQIAIKIDIEGAEAQIFAHDLRWLEQAHRVTWIALEWHNHDGHVYKEVLERFGFQVELEGGGPPPRPVWDRTIGGGLLHARRVG